MRETQEKIKRAKEAKEKAEREKKEKKARQMALLDMTTGREDSLHASIKLQGYIYESSMFQHL